MSIFHLTEISGKGKGLVASKPLDAGTEILQDTASVFVLSPKFRSRFCSLCSLESSSLKKCSRCKYVYYCDISCQREDWNEHKVECQCLKNVAPNVPTDFCMLVSRTLLKCYRSSTQENKAFIEDLISHADILINGKATMYNTYLHVIHEFLGDDLIRDIGLEDSELIEVMSKLTCNTFSITNEKFEEIGCGIFPVASSVNHSCYPNTHALFSGRTVALRALTKLETLQEITISYINTLALTKDRQSELLERYSFLCNCVSCTKQEDHFMTSGKCMATKDCDGLVDVNNGKDHCMKCGSLTLYPKGMHPNCQMEKLNKVLLKEGQDISLSALRNIVSQSEQCLHQYNVSLLTAFDQMFDICIEENKWESAIIWGQKALPGMRKYYVPFHPVLGTHLCKLGKIHSLLNNLQKGIKLLEEGYRILSIAYGASHQTVIDLSAYLMQLRAETGAS